MRTPLVRPRATMMKPPSVGAMAIGSRFNIDCTVNPIARCRRGSASPIVEKSVGEAMLDHAVTKTRPTKTQGQLGARA